MTTPKQIQSKPALNTSLNTSLIDKLKPTVKANADLAKQQSVTTTKATISAVKEVANLPANKDISYQILAEPISVFNPEAIINAGIAFVNTIGQAIIGANKEVLTRTAELSQNPDTNAQECINKAGKKCGAIAQNNYKLGQLTNGNIFSSAAGHNIVAANSYSLSTDSNIDMKTPLFGVNSQDSIWVANNSITQVADFKSGNYKQKLDFVEGSITSQSQNSTHISTETSTHVSKSIKVTGTQATSISGKETSVTGDSSIAITSGDTLQVSSYGGTSIQTNGDMFIGATKSNTLEKIAASNVTTDNNTIEEALNNIIPSGGNIIINSSASNVIGKLITSIISLGGSGMLTSSSGNVFTTSEGISASYGSTANMSITNGTTIISNNKISITQVGRFQNSGRNYLPINGKDIGRATLGNIPALPSLPQLPNKQLENCIPKNIKDKKASQDKLKEDLRNWKKGQLEEKDTIAVTPDVNVNTSSNPTGSNKTQIAQNNLNYFGKLSLPSSISNNTQATLVSSYSALNILSDKQNKNQQAAFLPIVTQLAEGEDTFFELLKNSDILNQASVPNPESIITVEYIKSFLIEVVPDKVLEDFLYPQFYLDLTKLDTSLLKTFTSLTVEDFVNSDKDKVNKILLLSREYKSSQTAIINLVTQSMAAIAIGGLLPIPSFVGSITNLITKNIKSLTNITKIPKIVESKQYGSLFDLAKPYATKQLNKVLKGTPFSELLNNTDLFEFGKAITKGDLTKAARDTLLKNTVDEVYNKTIKSVFEKTALKTLGIDDAYLPAIKDILNKVKVGQTIKPEDYITEITNILAKDNPALKGIKCAVNTTKYITFRQYLEAFANKAKIISDLTNNILQQEINTAFGILSPLLELEAKRLLEKDSFNIISPVLTDIYNNVKAEKSNNFQTYTNEIVNKLNINSNDCKIAAIEIYNNVKGLIEDISKGDILKIISGANTETLLTTLLGSNNAGSISKVFNLTKSAIGAYDSIKLIPDLLELMNSYKIPAIDQVNIALNCLDLFNKIKALLDNSKALDNNLDNFISQDNSKPAVALLENAGRMVQVANSINSVDDSTLEDWSKVIGDEYIDLQDFKVNLNTNLSLDKCFKVPKLNVFQSEIEVIKLENTALIFKLTNLEVLQDNFNLLPKINGLVQIRVQGFYSNSTKEYYVPYQTDYEYTPSVYSFVITSFDIEKNIGIAYYDKAYPSIVLENLEGVLYKFASEAIGITLSPDIVDSYLLA